MGKRPELSNTHLIQGLCLIRLLLCRLCSTLIGWRRPIAIRTAHYVLLLLAIGSSSCEQELTITLPEGEEKLVVEGHIEQGAPPVVVLSRTVPIFAPISLAQIEASLVRNAHITVSTANQSVVLQEYSLAQLPAQLAQLIEVQYGISQSGSSGLNFSFYSTTEMLGEIGKIYRLRIEHEGRVLLAKTSIPQLNPIDSLWVMPHPNPANQQLVALWYRYRDPDTLGNCIRYFTKRNQEPYYPGFFNSVYTDDIINGSPDVRFQLPRGQNRLEEVKFETYGYFSRGDTIKVRWCAIDQAHFRFWSSLEADRGSTGNPLGSPVKIQSNIEGGLGIWGGYGVSVHEFVVQ